MCGRVVTAVAAAAIIFAAPTPTPASPPCLPVARLSGDPAVVETVRAALGARGVPVEGGDLCGAVSVRVGETGGRIAVALVDADGRSVDRTAVDSDGAATIIESFARVDLAAPLLAARRLPSASTPAGELTVSAARAPGPTTRAFEIVLAADGGLSGDGARWGAGRLQGCVQFEFICLGALMRFAADTRTAGDSAALDTTRFALDALLLVEMPIERGRLTLRPGFAAGQTTLMAEREIAEAGSEHDSFGLLLRGHLGAGLRLRGGWHVRFDLAIGWAPFAPADAGAATTGARPLAGAPRLGGWLGAGLAYGKP